MVDLFEAVYIEMNIYRSMCAHIFSCRLIGPSLVPYDFISCCLSDQSSYDNSLDIFWYSLIILLLEKCPNTDFSLVRIFLYSVWIQENTDQKKLLIWTLFTQWNYLILSWLLCPKVSKINKVKLSLYFKT